MTEIVSIQFRSDSDTADRDIRELVAAMERLGAQTRRTSAATKQQSTAERSRARDIDRATRSTDRATRSQRTFQLGNVELSRNLKETAKSAALAAGAYIGLSQAKAAVDTTTELAKSTLTLHKNLGLSVKTAGAFAAVAKSRDIAQTSLLISTKTLSKQIEQAKQGTESSIKAFRDLGITQDDLRRKNMDQIFFAIADGAEKLGDGTKRTTALATLFGRSFGGLAPILRSGSAAMKEQLKEADALGASLGGKNTKQLEQLIAEQRRAKLATLGLQVAFGEELAPALTESLHDFTVVVKAIRGIPGPVKAAMNPLGGLRNTIKSLSPAAKDVWGAITGTFRDGVGTMRGFVNDIISVLNVIPGVDIGQVGGGGSSSDGSSSKTAKSTPGSGGRGRGRRGTTGRQAGGSVVPGTGSGDKVHLQAMVEPGEGIFVLNRNAMGALEAMNKAIPRFAGGGILDKLGGIGGALPSPGDLIGKLPGVGSLPDWMRGTGDFALDAAKKFITNQLQNVLGSVSLPGAGGGIPGLTAIGRALQKQGFQVGENPAFGGVTGVHAPGSYHYQGRAIDVNWPNQAQEPAHLRPLYNALAKTHPTELFYQNRGIPGPVPDHWDHLHLAFQKGGKLGGGQPGSPGGRLWTVDEAATLAWMAGAKPSEARLLSTKIMSESGGNAHAVGHDPGGTLGLGLWQITTGFNDDLIRRYGGRTGIMDPLNNAKAAIAILRRQGIGAWYGGSGAAGSIHPEWIDYPNRKKPKPKGKKPKKSKKPAGAGASTEIDPDTSLSDLTAEQWAVVAENARRGRASAGVWAGFSARPGLGTYQGGYASLTSPAPGSSGSPASVAPPTIVLAGDLALAERVTHIVTRGRKAKQIKTVWGRDARRRATGPGKG